MPLLSVAAQPFSLSLPHFVFLSLKSQGLDSTLFTTTATLWFQVQSTFIISSIPLTTSLQYFSIFSLSYWAIYSISIFSLGCFRLFLPRIFLFSALIFVIVVNFLGLFFFFVLEMIWCEQIGLVMLVLWYVMGCYGYVSCEDVWYWFVG